MSTTPVVGDCRLCEHCDSPIRTTNPTWSQYDCGSFLYEGNLSTSIECRLRALERAAGINPLDVKR